MNPLNLIHEIDTLIALSNEVESDEARDLLYAQIEQLQFERADKLNALADLKFSLEGQIEQQKKLLDVRKSRLIHTEAIIERLVAGEPLATAEHEFKFRKSTAVIVTNLDIIPESLRRLIPERYEADKTAIAKELKAGHEIDGAYLEVRSNLQIR